MTATSGNNFYFPAGTIGTFHTKFHHSTRSIDRYVDKSGKKPVSAVNAEQGNPNEEEIIEEDPVVVKEREVRRLKEIVKIEQKKIKICLECKRKFASQEQLKQHEELSEMHKANVEKTKAPVKRNTTESAKMELDNTNGIVNDDKKNTTMSQPELMKEEQSQNKIQIELK